MIRTSKDDHCAGDLGGAGSQESSAEREAARSRIAAFRRRCGRDEAAFVAGVPVGWYFVYQ
jgi:hypothetical protein